MESKSANSVPARVLDVLLLAANASLAETSSYTNTKRHGSAAPQRRKPSGVGLQLTKAARLPVLDGAAALDVNQNTAAINLAAISILVGLCDGRHKLSGKPSAAMRICL
jgi:hypothetical protein